MQEWTEIEEPMPIMDEMKEKRRQAVGHRIGNVNMDIRWAVKHGRNSTCFDVDRDDPYYEEVREAFERQGYRIKPTGVVGGVMQTTEEISW